MIPSRRMTMYLLTALVMGLAVAAWWALEACARVIAAWWVG
jgi:hypothetical protein